MAYVGLWNRLTHDVIIAMNEPFFFCNLSIISFHCLPCFISSQKTFAVTGNQNQGSSSQLFNFSITTAIYSIGINWFGNALLVTVSVTIWVNMLSIFGHLHEWKFAKWHTKFVKVRSKVCQILNYLSKNCQKLIKI